MGESIAILFVLGFVLAVVTLVGHGMWVFLAALLGQRSASSRGAVGRACPRCHAPLELHQQACALCGWPQPRGQQADGHAALRALRRQLEDFAWSGAVDAQTRARLAALIDAEERRLVEESLLTRPAAAPAEANEVAEIVLEPIEPGASVAAVETPPATVAEATAPSAVPLAERARQYAASREAAAAEALSTPEGLPAEPPKRREAVSRLLAAFMEEKNIRWGELVGGLLIVGCSIALVISFWSQIAERPLLKFGLLGGVTAALFAVGIYTDRRWKIHTTSHGLLAIATLLVPLNFLAIAAFTQASPPTDPLSLAGEGASLVVFAALVYLGGRILVPGDAVPLVAGVMIACLMQLVVRRFAGPATPLAGLYALAAVPIASYLASTLLVVNRRLQECGRHTPCAVADAGGVTFASPADGTRSVPATLAETAANRVLVFFGLVSAATLMPLALLLYNVPPARATLHWLSPLVAACGLPALLVGLLFWRRMTDRRFSGLQTAGIGVGVLGALMMAGAVALAWPNAVLVLPTALVAAALLTFAAERFDLPLLHTPARLAMLLALFSGVTAAVETRPWYVDARHPWLHPWFLQAQGIALAGYCLVDGAARWLFARSAKPQAAGVGVDRAAEVALVVLLALLAAYAVVPGAAQELSPTMGAAAADRVAPPIERFEIAGIPHEHAADRGAWLLLGAVAVTLVARMGQHGAAWRIAGLAFVAMAVCPLLAAYWEPQVAVASALRWLTAGFFAVLSIPIWLHKDRFAHPARDLLVAIVVLVYVAMGAYVCQAALTRASIAPDIQALWPWVSIGALVAGVAALVVPYAAEDRSNKQSRGWRLHARDVLLLLAVAPPAILLTFAVARALERYPIVGPEPGTWFRQIGWDVSYGVPLVVIALVLVGYAIRDRSSRFAFAAGLLFNVVATIVVLLRLARGGVALDGVAWVTVAQVNAVVAGVVGLAWLAAVEWHRRRGEIAKPQAVDGAGWPLLLITQVALAAALCGAFLVPAAVHLALVQPPSLWALAAAGAWGWVAVALAAVAAVWLNLRRGARQNGVALFAAALVALVALSAGRWDDGNWQAYHTLLAATCAAAWLVPILTRGADRLILLCAGLPTPQSPRRLARSEDRPQHGMIWSAPAVRLFAVAAVVLAIWGYDGDPAAPWWTIAALAVIGARNVWMAWHEARGEFVWIAAALFVPAASILWIDWGQQFSTTTGFGQALEFLWINVLAVAGIACVSVAIERGRIAPCAVDPRQRPGIGLHRFAAWAMVGTLLFAIGIGLLADLFNRPIAANLPLAWAAWLAAVVTAAACLWDPAIRWPVACLYCVGLLAVGLYLDGLDLRPPLFHWALANALAAYSLATSGLWSVRDRLRATFAQWGVPTLGAGGREQGVRISDSPLPAPSSLRLDGGHGWLVSANLLVGVGVLLLVGWIELTLDDFTQRMVAAYAVGAQALAIGLLAHGVVRTPLQYLALVWGVLFAVAFGWAWLPPDFDAPWLHRLVVTVAVLAVMVVLYGFGLVKFLKRENEWTRAAVRLVPSLAALAAVLILAVLAMEVAAYAEDGSVPIAWPALVAVGLALAGLAAAALAAALLPGRDPLGLSERGRTAYVYAAEALAALLFLHVRVTMPWLFTGWFQRFWPLIVMAIAFVGVGFGELFQRRRRRVLSEPLETTGALLPLLPALGFWFASSQVHYSLLLLSIGVLYAGMAVLRQSFAYGVLAAIAANGALWYLLSMREGLSLVEHPQLWLIPPALCALAAGYINRERLTQQQSATLRYASAITIYVSSTADVFIHGVADAPWLPAVLAGLSIVGVLAGIMLRVRAFLYLGTAFLVVALMSVIWHAAEQQTWIWWVAGIVTGVLIIALFGVFEKRRDDVLRVVEQLKQWQA